MLWGCWKRKGVSDVGVRWGMSNRLPGGVRQELSGTNANKPLIAATFCSILQYTTAWKKYTAGIPMSQFREAPRTT